MQHFFHFRLLPQEHSELRCGVCASFTNGLRFSVKIVPFVFRRLVPSGSVLPYFGDHQWPQSSQYFPPWDVSLIVAFLQ
jgi:hypothetical protein